LTDITIDFDRLELVVGAFIHEAHLPEFDLPTIVRNAEIVTEGFYLGTIKVQSSKWIMWFDADTYEQINGIGGDVNG